MHRPIGGKHFVARLPVVATAEVGHFTTCLHQDQGTGGNVPGTDISLDTGFEPSGCDIAYFGCGRSHQTGSSGKAVQPVDEAEGYRAISIRVVRKSQIDKSFVDNIGDERGNKIVDGIIRLAESLELSTIAEGVETREQYEYLKAHGCDVIQGYYFGRPMTAESFEMLLRSQTAGR